MLKNSIFSMHQKIKNTRYYKNFQIKLTKRKSAKHYLKIFLSYFVAVRFTNKLISCVDGARYYFVLWYWP